MSVPTNLIPTLITGLQEYTGSSTLGYMPYILDGRTYKVQFANIAAVGAVPSSRVIAAGTGLAGGGDLSANRVISIANGGVGFDQLALSGVTQGTYGSGSAIPILTVDSKGRITSATTAPLDVTGFVPTSRTITAGDGLTGGGSLANNISLAANFSATTPSALGTASAGTAITVSRGDHVHPAVNLSDTTQTQGALPLGRGGTGDALSPVAGAVVYSTGSKFALTNPGLPGQVLSSNGTDEPQWTSVGAGTVISVGVATANGFAGTVTNPSLNPVITLSTTVTGMLKGDGTAVSAATAGVDYVEPGAYVTSGLTMASARLLGRTTASVGAAEELTVGAGLTLSGGSLVNAAPDQVVALTGGTAISVTGTYPSFTITNTAPDQTVSLTAGTAISITGTYPSFSVTNTAPDQVVSLTGAGTTTVTGTYPSFTITSNDSTSGTVTSVNASGGTTGMSFTGGPITSAGTLTLNGTLAVANGGTGATDAATALTNLGAYPASNPSGFTSNVGTVTSVSGTGTVSGLSLSGTVTSAGSLTLGGTLAVLPSNFASQTANTVLAAPNGSAGTPTFRAIVAADIPTLNQNTTGTASNVTGIVAVANGGTGASVAGTARTNLGAAASGANTDITSIALTTGTISTSPTSGTDIVNKDYADSIASGINFHQSVRLATTAALSAYTYNNGTSGVGATITANANGALSVDGVAAVAGNRVLIKNESGAAEAYNGVYTVTQVGNGSTPYILTRATDFDSSGSGVDQIDAGDFFLVTAGSTLANTSWVQQTPLPITVGTTAIVFTQFGAPITYSAGTGLSLTGTTFSITNTGVSASTYGSASSVPVIAVNAQGQITSASASSIAIAASQITSGALAIANGGTGATSAATALTNLGAYPASNPSGFTSNTGTVTSVNLTAGTGVSVSGGPITASGSITVTNTAPDQVVSLTGSGATTVTGTYPNFTISSPTSGAGTVTSIDVSGGTTGLTTSGGPVTTSGTITLAGTLNVANGGTGATTLSSGYVLKGNGTSAVSASVIYDNGTNVGIGTASPANKLDVAGVIRSASATFGNSDVIAETTASTGTGYSRFILKTTDREWRLVNDASTSGSPFLLYDATAAATRLLVNSSGNVGIGTASPSTKLTVSDGAITAGAVSDVLIGRYSSTFPTSGAGYFRLRTNNTDSNNGGISIDTLVSGTLTERFVVNTSGNVIAAVDMRAPIFYDSENTAFYLDPNGSTSLNTAGNLITSGNLTLNIGANRRVRIGSATNYSYDLQTTGDDFQIIEAGVTPRLTIKYPNGNLGLGNVNPQSRFTIGSAQGNSLEFTYSSDNAYRNIIANYWNSAADTRMDFNIGRTGNVAPVTVMSVGYNSNVGIGTVTPLAKSHVVASTPTGIGALPSGVTGILDSSGNNYLLFRHSADNATYSGIAFQDNNMGGYVVFGNYGANPSDQIAIAGYNGGILQYGTSDTINPALRTTVASWNSTGLQINNGDMRAPIYYDSNDTGYYLDAASTSRINQINYTGLYSAADGNYGVIGGNGYFDTVNSGYAGDPLELCYVKGTEVRVGTGGGNLPIKASIYYKGTNTAYFVNPDGTSILNTVSVAQNNGVNFNGAGSTYIIGTSGDGASSTTSNLKIQSWFGIGFGPSISGQLVPIGENAVWINARDGDLTARRIIVAQQDARAPIFYDLDNTAYYVSPNTVSNLADLRAPNVVHYPGWPGYPGVAANDYGFNAISSFTYGNNAPYVGPFVAFAAGGYNLQLNAPYSGDGYGLAFRTRNGDTSTFNSWRYPAVYDVNVNGGGALYASVYYDQNNTAYYIDPASTSVLNTTFIGTHGKFYDDGNFHIDGVASPVWINSLNNDAIYLNWQTTGAVLLGNSARSPIFYDSDNTAYFVNPNSNSALAGALVIGPTGGGAYTRFGASAGDTTYSTISASNGNLHIDSQAGYDLYLNWYTARPVWSEGGAYFPVYYDRNNTGFFINPATSSTLANLDVASVIDSAAYYDAAIEIRERSFGGVLTTSFNNAPRLAFHWGGRVAMQLALGSDNILNVMNGDCSGFTTFRAGDVYGNIFYDRENTAFFVDPNSTSVLSTVRAAGIQHSSGNSAIILDSGVWTQFCDVNGVVKLWLGGTSDPNNYYNAGIHYFRNTSSSNTMTIDSSGNVVATANVTAYSDARLKKDVETIGDALGLVGKMRGVTYTRKDTGEAGVGVIAQEMLEVMPQAVHRGTGDNDTLSVAYGNLVGVLIEAIKELEARVAELEGK